MEPLHYFPDTLDILQRRIYINVPSHKIEQYEREELVFRNSGGGDIIEIELEIDRSKTELKIEDGSGTNIVYILDTGIMDREAKTAYINQDNRNGVNNNKFNIRIFLNTPLAPGKQQNLIMMYFKIPKLKSSPKPQLNSFLNLLRKSFIVFEEEQYIEPIQFYKQETLTFEISWEDGLLLDARIIGLIKDKKPLDLYPYTKFTNLLRATHGIRYSLSPGLETESETPFPKIIYSVKPSNSEKWLIGTLLGFALLFPWTEALFIIFQLNSISRLFDILEVEVVIILTLTFAQLRTILIDYKQYLTFTIIIMASLFGIGLYLL